MYRMMARERERVIQLNETSILIQLTAVIKLVIIR